MNDALVTELTKAIRGHVLRATTVLMVLGIALICSSMLLAVDTADPQLAAKLGALNDPGGWAGYLTVAAQVTAAAGLLGYGVALSWLFGREFGEGTITGLFALPVARPTIAAAKLGVYAAWVLTVGIALLIALTLLGLAFGLGPIPREALPAMGRQLLLAVLTGAIATPAAWAATLGRSVLAGIATTIAILVVAQVAVVGGAGGWLPFAAPSLWAVSGGSAVTAFQLSLVAPLAGVSAGLVLLTWRRLQLDR